MPRRPSRNPWSQLELRVCRRSARLLLRGKFPSASDAARSAVRRIAQLHREHPGERWAGPAREHNAVLKQVLKLARVSRWKWPHATFSPEEDEVLDAYALHMTRQRFPSVTPTAQACWKELERRHRRDQQRVPPEQRVPQPRSLTAVWLQVQRRSVALGRPRVQSAWTQAEAAIALKCWRRLLRTRGRRGRPLRSPAGRIMAIELKRNGFDRTQASCLYRLRRLDGLKS